MSLTHAYTVLYTSADVEAGTTASPFIIAGAGVAGTPAGGVVSVQGVVGGTAMPVSGTVTANQGTAAVLANAWSTKLTDGTNGPVAVKAPSTAPVAADPALVVAISPNSSLIVNQTRPATATVTSVTVAVASTTILASNVNRLGAILWNQTGTTFVKLGTTASSTSYTVRLAINSEWEVPTPVYTGIITGSASAATNILLATELTP